MPTNHIGVMWMKDEPNSRQQLNLTGFI